MFRYISGKNNAMADMLSRAKFADKLDMMDKDEEIKDGFFVNTLDHEMGLLNSVRKNMTKTFLKLGGFYEVIIQIRLGLLTSSREFEGRPTSSFFKMVIYGNN
jgi:hypothetical protein